MSTTARWPPLIASRPTLIVQGSDALLRDMVMNVLDLARVLQEVREGLAQAIELPPIQYGVLWELACADLHLTPSVLAERLRVTNAHIVTELKKLTDAGLVSRRRNPRDGRSILVALSPKGRAKMGEISSLVQRVHDALFERLTADNVAALNSIAEDILTSSMLALARVRRPY